jgi:hypothetical protein
VLLDDSPISLFRLLLLEIFGRRKSRFYSLILKTFYSSHLAKVKTDQRKEPIHFAIPFKILRQAIIIIRPLLQMVQVNLPLMCLDCYPLPVYGHRGFFLQAAIPGAPYLKWIPPG